MLRADLISPRGAGPSGVRRAGRAGGRARKSRRSARARARGQALASGRARRAAPASELQVSRPAPGVEYFNGLGGFAEGGREYVTILGPGQSTPAPWINVIANPGFGFQVVRRGRRLRLVAEQPRTSADAVVQRPGDRPARPGLLSEGRGNGRMSGARRRCRSGMRPPPMSRGMAGATAASSMPRTASPPTAGIRAARRSDQDLAADAAQRSRAAPRGFR